MANGFDTTQESYVGDDPTGIGYDEAAQTYSVPGVGYGSESIDTGGNETTGAGDGQILSQAGFNQAMGITTTNPYPNSFFSQLFGPENVNYAVLGIDTQGIANLAYDRYRNPFGDTTGITKFEDLKLREGLSEGEKTRYGEVISVDRPQGIGETIARTAFGLGTPLGPLAGLIGTDQLALAPDDKTGFRGSPNYDPKLDPNSPEYQGPQSMLGGIGRFAEQITFGGARPVTKTSKGILDLIQGQDAEKEIKDSVDQTGKNVLEESSVSLMEPGANLASSFNTSRTTFGDLPTIRPGVTNPNMALALGIQERRPELSLGEAMNMATMELAKRKKLGIK